MKSLKWGAIVLAVAVLGGALSTACSPTFVVMQPPGQDTIVDTVVVNGVPTRTMRIFRVDTVTRVDTVVRTRTVTRPDTVAVLRVDTVFRTDTIFRTRTSTRVDTVAVPVRPAVTRTDTVVRVDTVRVISVDTVHVVSVDTVRLTRVDTLIRPDTVLVPGRRMLFVPPGHYPPEGQCRIWIHDQPPGRQAQSAACDALGAIPPGAFILFGGDAWDADYDWAWEAARNPGTVPPVIIAVTRAGSS